MKSERFTLFKNRLIFSGDFRKFEAEKKARLKTRNSEGFSIEFMKAVLFLLSENRKRREMFVTKSFLILQQEVGSVEDRVKKV